MLTDIEIAQSAKMKPIAEVAESIGISYDELELYGKYKAKLSYELEQRVADRPDGKLILVTAINPTPAGEGKTTTTVGLGQAMGKLGKKAIIALREPSLGPVFGIKGGAAGGGYAQVVPMEDINLHFTGDMHAITAANNLLCAAIDNHIQQGNALGIDPRTITFKRVMDMNDRALRNIVIGLGGKMSGVPREDGFMITVASEIMAILCLAYDLMDLKEKFANIMIGYTYDGKPVYCRDIGVQGAMATLMKDAIHPNLVQTLENTPCLMHGGPFANIAHGCNSVKATRLGLKLADYTITEAGFGADLGAEKFLDIKCVKAGLTPNCVVLVATIRALKYNGGVARADLAAENVEALRAGASNLKKHIENIQQYGVPMVVTLNRFATDTDAEIAAVEEICKEYGVECILGEGFAKGGDGMTQLAQRVCGICDNEETHFKPIYDLDMSLTDKARAIVQKIYGGDDIHFEAKAAKQLKEIEDLGYGNLPVCMAKTQYSLSDDQTKLGRPTGFIVTVRDVRLCSGAGFVVMLTGSIMTMPGLPGKPAANSIDINEAGEITGLF